MANVPLNMAIRLNGVDETAGAFDSVAAKAANIGRKMSAAFKVAAGAFAAIGAGSAVKSALDGMTQLHDAAQQAGVSSTFLQKFSGAMAQAGVSLGQSEITTSVQKLNAALANTEKINAFQKLGVDVSHLRGLKPEDAFTGFLDVVSQIPDEQTRLMALQQGLEEQGLRLAPLMRLGPEAFKRSLEDVMGMIPSTSEKTVNMATDLNNAFSLVSDSVKNDFWNALGSVLEAGTEAFGGLDVAVAGLYERFRYFCKNIVSIFGGVWKALSSGWDTFVQTVQVGLATIGGKMLNLRDRLSAGIAKQIGKTFYGWEEGGDEMAGVDAYRDQLIADRNAKIDAISKGTIFDEVGQAMAQNASEYESRMAAVRKGFAAKAQLTAMTPNTQPLSEAIESAVSSGVKDGLAEGVEYGSYAVLKNAFKARTMLIGGGKMGPVATATNAASTAAAPRTIFATPENRSPNDRTLLDILSVLKKIFDCSDKANKQLATLGSF